MVFLFFYYGVQCAANKTSAAFKSTTEIVVCCVGFIGLLSAFTIFLHSL